MLRKRLLVLGAGLLLTAMQVNAAPPSPSSKLDVTMNVVPLDANIEKSVVHTITLPKKPDTADSKKQVLGNGKKSSTNKKTNETQVNTAESSRKTVLREVDDARREAAEAAKEAQKDRDNSGADDDDNSPPG